MELRSLFFQDAFVALLIFSRYSEGKSEPRAEKLENYDQNLKETEFHFSNRAIYSARPRTLAVLTTQSYCIFLLKN